MEAMSPVLLGTIFMVGFLPPILLRPWLLARYVETARTMAQPRRAFLLDFSICLAASILISAYSGLALGFPFSSLTSLIIGCLIVGFFIGLESSLAQERSVILKAMKEGTETLPPRRYFPMTGKFTLVAVTTSICIGLVLIMVFTHDVRWLIANAGNADLLSEARKSVFYEITFITAVLMLLLVNLIFSYSKNLKLLFTNETDILEKVSNGNLAVKVPVATNDEFGVIAGHTNTMIDGLRHRFELVQQMKLAEEIQQNLLPSRSPYLSAFDVDGTSLYCDNTGGDYYDYFLLPEEKFGIVVADACGHGVGAAMLMTTVRAFLHSAAENYTDPATLLASVNSFISRDCAVSGRFTTMFFLEIDQKNRRLRWSRAGHEPPLYYHAATDTFSKLSGKSLVLGVNAGFVYQTHGCDRVESGDILLIGTDGIHEARNSEGELFGHDRVQALLRTHRRDSARAVREHLVDAICQFRGDMDQEDDITLVIVKIK